MMRTTLSGLSWQMILSLLPPSVLPYQLVAVTEFLIPPNFEVCKKTLDRLVKGDLMRGKLLALKIVLEVRRRESVPVRQSSFYCRFLGLVRLTTQR